MWAVRRVSDCAVERLAIAHLHAGSVRNAVRAFAAGIANTPSRLRIVEFDAEGRSATIDGSTGFEPVDSDYLAAGGPLENYLTGSGGQDATSYSPGTGATNWEAGFRFTAADPGPGDLVVFLTDGLPNISDGLRVPGIDVADEGPDSAASVAAGAHSQ